MSRIARLNCSPMARPSGEPVRAVRHMAHWASEAAGRIERAAAVVSRATSPSEHLGAVFIIPPRSASTRGVLQDVMRLGPYEGIEDERREEDARGHHDGEVLPLEAQVHEVPADEHGLHHHEEEQEPDEEPL